MILKLVDCLILRPACVISGGHSYSPVREGGRWVARCTLCNKKR